MNKKTFILLAITAIATLASCNSEDTTDNPVNTLPEGMYPLTFTATQGEVVASPQSRVAESTDGASSKWNDGDQIEVQIGNGTAGSYSLNTDGTIKSTNKPVYWQSNADGQDITAWYPASAASDYLKDQSYALHYVLKATTKADFNTTPSLPFKHKLAKFRFKLNGTAITQGVTPIVIVNSIAKTTYDNGDIQAASDATAEEITPHKNGDYYEVLLLPGKVADNFIAITVPGIDGTYHFTPKDVDKPADNLTLAAASCYTYDITVDVPGPTAITGGETITKPGDYIMSGNITQTVTLNGDNINLTLDNVTANTNTPIKITNGTPVIKITGTNTFTTKDGTPGIHLDGSDANVEITGDGLESSSLKIKVEGTNNGFPGSGIGSFGSYNSCGNIKISNITLTVQGGYDWSYDTSGAAIGTGAGYSGSCGSITIEKSVVSATATPFAAAIGFGRNDGNGGSIPSITITDSQLNLTVTGEGAGIGFGYNWKNVTQTLGPVTITSSNEDKSTFFAKERFNVEGYKVGKSSNNYSIQIWEGVTFNGNPLAYGSDNGYK